MPVPDYQTLMAPVLQALADGQPRLGADVRTEVARIIGLSDTDRRETITSGTPLFDSRVQWSITYLAQAGLIRRPRRGVVQLTDRGRDVLAEHPRRVDNNVLSRFVEFNDFRTRARPQAGPNGQPDVLVDSAPPQETIDREVRRANAAVAQELLDRVRDREPAFLERLVLKVLTAMGYGGASGGAEHLGRANDRGLDGVIRQDPLGLDRIYVQAKRYAANNPVGRPEIQEFVGALHGAQADRGIFVTTSRFSAEAQEYAERVQARVVLIDGEALAQYMVTYDIGVQNRNLYTVKRVDEDFFEEA